MRLCVEAWHIFCCSAAKRSRLSFVKLIRAILIEGCQHQCDCRGIFSKSLWFFSEGCILIKIVYRLTEECVRGCQQCVLGVKDLSTACRGLNLSIKARCILCTKMLAKWFYPTRLETRTKESNLCASMWVLNPYAK